MDAAIITKDQNIDLDRPSGTLVSGMLTAITRRDSSHLERYQLHVQTPVEELVGIRNSFGLSGIEALIGKIDWNGEIGRRELREALPITIRWAPRYLGAKDSRWHMTGIRQCATVMGRGLQSYDVIEVGGALWVLRKRGKEYGEWYMDHFAGSLFEATDSPTLHCFVLNDVYAVERSHPRSVRNGGGWG